VHQRTVIVIGSGFAGLSAATFMAKAGWKVTVLEKNDGPGGRARQYKEKGFSFDMGPSFYWMPDVFERYFRQFGKTLSSYYSLQRLDPSYRVYWQDSFTDIPASFDQLQRVFESIEPGSASQLDKFLKGAQYKYELGINKLVHKPGRSLLEFIDWPTIRGLFRLQVFTSIKKHIAKYFRNKKLRQLMEFPVLFLGALPEDTPALYSLMNYADIKGGTWYPGGGMFTVVESMYQLAKEFGVVFHFNEEVREINVAGKKVNKIITTKGEYTPDAVISSADYAHTESLLPSTSRNYSDQYWQERVMAPSCLLYYVGLNKKLKNAVHHSLFFDVSFDQHGKEIYKDPQWPHDPLFYVSIPSVTDPSTAPAGHEAIVFLIPIASGLTGDDETLRNKYFDMILSRMEKHFGEPIRDSIVLKRSYSVEDFTKDYHSFKGNAYGLANTLKQTAIFRPSCESHKLGNLFFTGQLTVPGPGVPPCIISGEVVAKQLLKRLG
jgi:phytoene desaturase